jgi:hypothetical protein
MALWLTLFTGLLVIVSGFSAYFFYQQRDVMEAQLDQMKASDAQTEKVIVAFNREADAATSANDIARMAMVESTAQTVREYKHEAIKEYLFATNKFCTSLVYEGMTDYYFYDSDSDTVKIVWELSGIPVNGQTVTLEIFEKINSGTRGASFVATEELYGRGIDLILSFPNKIRDLEDIVNGFATQSTGSDADIKSVQAIFAGNMKKWMQPLEADVQFAVEAYRKIAAIIYRTHQKCRKESDAVSVKLLKLDPLINVDSQ